MACGQCNKCLFFFSAEQEKHNKVMCSSSELGVDPWKRTTAAIVAIKFLSWPHLTFLNNNSRSVVQYVCPMTFFFNIYRFETRSKVLTQDAAALPCLCQRLHPVATTHWPTPIEISSSYFSRAPCVLRHRNWCAYVVTRTVSCVMEDGVETYIKPDYQRCTWGQCPRVAWVSTAHFVFHTSSHSCALPVIWRDSVFGATPTVSFPYFRRLVNHHSIHVLPLFPVADTDSTQLLLLSPKGESFLDSVWLCLDMCVARTSPEM